MINNLQNISIVVLNVEKYLYFSQHIKLTSLWAQPLQDTGTLYSQLSWETNISPNLLYLQIKQIMYVWDSFTAKEKASLLPNTRRCTDLLAEFVSLCL